MKKTLCIILALIFAITPFTVISASAYSSARIVASDNGQVSYREKVQITAITTSPEDGYYVALYDGETLLLKSKDSVTFVSDELKQNKTFTARIIDENGAVQTNRSGEKLEKQITVTVNSSFIKKIIAFFRSLFGKMPVIKLNYTLNEADYKALCTEYTYEELLRYPDKYTGQKIKMTGEIFDVHDAQSSNYYSVYLIHTEALFDDLYYDDIVYLLYDNYNSDGPRLIKNDIITVYGKFGGLKTYTTAIGGSLTVPLIYVEYVDVK